LSIGKATAVLLCGVLLAPATAARASHSLVDLISTGPVGGAGEFGAYSFRADAFGNGGGGGAVSRDGSRILFQTAERLVPEDTDAYSDVYERVDGVTHLLSIGPSGGNGPSYAFFIASGGDTTHVFFTTSEKLVPEDSDTRLDIYERYADQTRLVTTGPTGTDWPIRLSYGDFRVSKDGEHAFFNSDQRLVSGDTDNEVDVYERHAGQTTLVTVGTREQAALPYFLTSGRTTVSSDGSRVFLDTHESIDPRDGDGGVDVYEFSGGKAKLISSGSDAEALPPFASRNDRFVGMSEDGTRVFFSSQHALAPDDTDTGRCTQYDFSNNSHAIPCQDIYERSQDKFTLVSVGENEPIADHAFFESATPDGTHVYFRSESPFTSEDRDGTKYPACSLRSCEDIFERFAGRTRLISTGPADPHKPDTYIVGSNPIFDWVTPDGSAVFFRTYVRLVPEDTDFCYDLYSRSGDQTELMSTGASGSDCSSLAFGGAADDGSRAFFVSEQHLTADDTDTGCAYFDNDDFYEFEIPCVDVYERRAGRTTLISTGPLAANGAYHAYFYGNSGNGAVAVFGTKERLTSADADGCPAEDPYEYGGYIEGPGCADVYAARTAPPDCSRVVPSATVLWPPNGKFRAVALTGAVDAQGTALTARITTVTQDEPAAAGDARLTATSNRAYLRAARRGNGDGRVYRIAFEATDADGESCRGTVAVTVPHSKNKGAKDSGPPYFDSLQH